jgi:YD repeat-containing protein
MRHLSLLFHLLALLALLALPSLSGLDCVLERTREFVRTGAGFERIAYRRDLFGRLSEIQTSTGLRTHYKYDRYHRMEKVVDSMMAGAGAAAQLGEIRYQYDNLDRKARVDYPNGASTVYDYEPLTGWTDVITHRDKDGAILLRIDFARDR